MANRRVRLYEGPSNESTIIGFSASAIPDGKQAKEELFDFFRDRGYDAYPLQIWAYPTKADTQHEAWNNDHFEAIKAVGSVSLWHCGIEPPLRNTDLPAFAHWCRDNINVGHNYGFVIDNRQLPPANLASESDTDGAYLYQWG